MLFSPREMNALAATTGAATVWERPVNSTRAREKYMSRGVEQGETGLTLLKIEEHEKALIKYILNLK